MDAPQSGDLLVPTDGLVLRHSARLRPGVYLLPAGITLDADHLTLDGNGATLIGADRQGVGIRAAGHSHLVIRNLRLRDYHHGIVVSQAQDVLIERNQITSTGEIPANTIFLDIWRPAGDPYGGAILLDQVEDAQIQDNDLQHQMNGLLIYRSQRLQVRRNLASYNSGFGIYLHQTCDSVFEENWADCCCRYEPRDGPPPRVGAGSCGHLGADAAGFVIVRGCCRNVFRHNFARLSGDGFFLAGRDPEGHNLGCNDNVFEENDGSLSPNIAFEATFSSGNIFRGNWADRSNYGFWLGYSTGNLLEGNRMLFNRQAGIAVEHGVGFTVRHNDFQSNGHGILLWTKYVREFLGALGGASSSGSESAAGVNLTVRNWVIERNRFYRNGTAIAILADRDHGIRPVPAEDAGRPELRPCDNAIRQNDIQDNRVGIHLSGADRTVIEQNKISKNVEADLRREDDRDTVLGHNLGLRGAYL